VSEIFVCPLSALDETLRTSGTRSMIAFGGPEAKLEHPTQIDRYLALQFNDIDEPRDGLQEPTREHVEQVIDFIDDWDQRTPILLQCWMGISRSTAAAAIALARLRCDLEPQEIANRLRTASPTATPNPLMIHWADELLELDGRFTKAIADIGRGAAASEGVSFSLAL